MSARRCDERFQELVAYARGELDPEEVDAVERHLAECEGCRVAAETSRSLNDLVITVHPDPIFVRRLEVAIAAGKTSRSSGGPMAGRWMHTPALFAAAVSAVVLSAAVALWALLGGGDWGASPTPEQSTVKNVSSAERPILTVETADDEHAIELLQETTVWVRRGSSVEVVEDSERLAKIRLRKGGTIIRRGEHSSKHRVVVVTPSSEIEAYGTIFSIEIVEGSAETVRVVEGMVVLRLLANGSKYVLSQGEEMTLGSLRARPARPEDLDADRRLVLGLESDEAVAKDDDSKADPGEAGEAASSHGGGLDARGLAMRAREAIDEGEFEDAERHLSSLLRTRLRSSEGVDLMVRLARAYRSERRFEMAAHTYERLDSLFPDSKAAVNGLVALAQIEQDTLGRSAIALVHFDRYLSREPSGPLAEPARAGRVRALYRLGRYAEVVAASNEYLDKHREGVSAAEVAKKRELALGKN